jgi:ATP-dependent 26S proteasome regulatory subunit
MCLRAGKDGSSDGQQLPDWDSLGGLQPVIRQLKEMVLLPLLYPSLYQQMGITAPR